MKHGRLMLYFLFSVFLLVVGLLSAETASWGTSSPARIEFTVPTATPQPVGITLTVALQRPNAPPPDAAWAVPVQLAFYPPGDPNTINSQWDLTLDASGHWAGNLAVAQGTYDVRIRNLHTLRNVKRNVVVNGPLILALGALLEGDANADNTVNILDFARLRNSFFLDAGMPGYDPAVDFDENRTINILDFGLLRSNFFKEGDIEVAALAQGTGLNAVQPVTLTLTPSERDLAVGEVLSFTVVADARQQPLLGLDVEILFRPEIVAVVDASGAPVSALTPGSAFAEVLANRVDAASGRILYSTANFGEAVSGQLEIVTFYLRGVQPGSAEGRFGPRSLGLDDSYLKVPLTLSPPVITVKAYRTYLPLSLRHG